MAQAAGEASFNEPSYTIQVNPAGKRILQTLIATMRFFKPTLVMIHRQRKTSSPHSKHSLVVKDSQTIPAMSSNSMRCESTALCATNSNADTSRDSTRIARRLSSSLIADGKDFPLPHAVDQRTPKESPEISAVGKNFES